MLGSVLQQHALGSGVSALNYTPDQQAWSSGNRSASCVLLDPNSRHTGSMLAPSGPSEAPAARTSRGSNMRSVAPSK